MSRQAFFVAGGKIVHIANPCDAGLQYQAHPALLNIGAVVGPFCHQTSETLVLVREGTIEVMINGAVAIVDAGDFVRVSPGLHYGYRNCGERPARLLIRTAPEPPRRRCRKITIEMTAA